MMDYQGSSNASRRRCCPQSCPPTAMSGAPLQAQVPARRQAGAGRRAGLACPPCVSSLPGPHAGRHAWPDSKGSCPGARLTGTRGCREARGHDRLLSSHADLGSLCAGARNEAREQMCSARCPVSTRRHVGEDEECWAACCGALDTHNVSLSRREQRGFTQFNRMVFARSRLHGGGS